MPTEFSCSIRSSGGDYSLLSSWEAANQVDLIAVTTKVFAHGGITGTIADGDSVTGQTSSAIGTVVHASATQILLKSITGTFQSGEVVQVTAGNSVTVSDAGDSASSVAECADFTDTSQCTISPVWIASAINKLIIRPEVGSGFNGIPGNGYQISAFKNYGGALTINAEFTTVEHIGARNTGTSSSRGIQATVGNVTVDGCLGSTASTTNVAGAFEASSPINFRNCLAYDSNLASGFRMPNWSSDSRLAYNCVAEGCDIGFSRNLTNGTGPLLKNCVSYGNTTDYGAGPWSSNCDYNATDATVSTNVPGTNPVTSIVTGDFVDTANNDYHLSSTSQLKDQGVDLSADFTTDVDGDTRTAPWDIGFDEFVALPGAAILIAYLKRPQIQHLLTR